MILQVVIDRLVIKEGIRSVYMMQWKWHLSLVKVKQEVIVNETEGY